MDTTTNRSTQIQPIKITIDDDLSDPQYIETDHHHHHVLNHLRMYCIIPPLIAKQSLSSILTHFHAGYFCISLSLGSQTLLWKTLIDPTTTTTTKPAAWTNFFHTIFHHHNFTIAYKLLWSISLLILSILTLLYLLRCLLHFPAVKSEYFHHVGVNYLFTPFTSWLLLQQTSPFLPPQTPPFVVLWWVFITPVFALDVIIYGQWFTEGKRFLTAEANPSCLISVIGNLLGARAAAQMGWMESARCLFSIGMVHYMILFVTLYQRIPAGTTENLPGVLRPVVFLFVAAPGAACLAWERIAGQFDISSKMLFFLSVFLFLLLICRPLLFKESMNQFNVAWWDYSFPINILAATSAKYAQVVKGGLPNTITIALSCISVLLIIGLTVFSLLNTRLICLSDTDADPTDFLTPNPGSSRHYSVNDNDSHI